MSFNVKDWTNSTDVVTTSDISKVSWFVADPANDLVLFKIVFDGISFINIWVWESDGSGIVSDNVWDLVWPNGFLNDFTEFEVGFFVINFDESKSAFFVIKESVVLWSFDDVKNIHNSDWEFMVSSDFIIDFESCLFVLSDDGDFFSVSGQSEAISGMKKVITWWWLRGGDTLWVCVGLGLVW